MNSLQKAFLSFAALAVFGVCAAQEVSTIRLDKIINADGMAFEANGDLLITTAFDGTTVERVDVTSGAVSTAVTGLRGPINVAVDDAGNIYNSNWTGTSISRTTPAGATSDWVIVETGGDGLAFDDNGDLWWTSGTNSLIRKITPAGVVSQVASGGLLNYPLGIALAEDGNFYVSEGRSGQILRVTKAGVVSFFAQVPGTGQWKLGQITAGNGKLYAAGQNTNRVFEIDMDGNVSILAGSGQSINSDGVGEAASLDNPLGAVISNDASELYVISGTPGTNALRVIRLKEDSAGDFQINAGLSDAWYNPATSGQGFLITVFPDQGQVFLAWFTYDTERPADGVTALLGEPSHRWLTAQGPYEGNTANLTLFVTKGGVLDSAQPGATTDPAGAGSLTIEFADCTEALVSYEITALGITGQIPIERISPDNVPFCEELNAVAQ